MRKNFYSAVSARIQTMAKDNLILTFCKLGALLGISVFRKVYNELIFLTNGDLSHSKYFINTISTFFSWRFFINFGLLNFLLICVLLIPKFLRWLAFGTLNDYEIKSIKEKFNYTLFEFIMGLILLKHIESESLTIKGFAKYASISICVVLLKSFHYLSAIRVKTFINNNNSHGHGSGTLFKKQSIKLILGMLMLTLIDSLLIYKFSNEYNFNTLSIIFGYELLNLFPLILLNLFNFTTSIVCLGSKKSIIKSKIILDFLVNLARFSLFVIYSWYFNLYFTFPVHIIPSSYKCFRLLLTKTKKLIAYKRNSLRFKLYSQSLQKVKLDEIELIADRCFCLEDLRYEGDDADLRMLCCKHVFHYECLKWWLIKSRTCPICREHVHLHKQKVA